MNFISAAAAIPAPIDFAIHGIAFAVVSATAFATAFAPFVFLARVARRDAAVIPSAIADETLESFDIPQQRAA